jgi:hypothetical protein
LFPCDGLSLDPPERTVPASLSSLITVPARDISAALSGGGAASRRCLRQWLLLVPDPRKRAGRWHPLEFVLALAVCAFTAAGHDSPTAITEWAAGCPRQALLILGGRADPLTGRVWPPSTRTFRRVFAKISADALNQALYGFLEVMPPAAPGELPEVTRHEREQCRAAATAREPAVPGLRPHAAADGKTARGAVRPDGSQVHLLDAIAARLTETDDQFADATWTEQGKGHGRRERRTIRTAPADSIDWPGAAQVLRIRRDTGPTAGPWAGKEIAYGITSLPADLAGPRHLAIYARQHWAIENREHYVRSPRRHIPGRRTENPHRKPAQRARRHPQPRHRRIPQERTCQHRRSPPLLRPRRPAHPRPLRVRLTWPR